MEDIKRRVKADQRNLLLYSYLRLLRNVRSKCECAHTMQVGKVLVVRSYVTIYVYSDKHTSAREAINWCVYDEDLRMQSGRHKINASYGHGNLFPFLSESVLRQYPITGYPARPCTQWDQIIGYSNQLIIYIPKSLTPLFPEIHNLLTCKDIITCFLNKNSPTVKKLE